MQIGWLKAEDQTVLTLHKRVITHNPRVRVAHDEQRAWTLRIASVQEEDRGCYMCQINTDVMKKQIGCIDVLVPPDIDSVATSSDVVVAENHNVTLTCKASGLPQPTVSWKREDENSFVVFKEGRYRGSPPKKVSVYEGEKMSLFRVRRKDMGAFMCIAKNGVPPSVGKRIMLKVNFFPTVKVATELVGCPIGEPVVVKCNVEAHPKPILYWMRKRERSNHHSREMLISNENFAADERQKSDYEYEMTLRIRSFDLEDIGVYSCIATNSMGRHEGAVRLYRIPGNDHNNYEIEVTSRSTSTSVSMTSTLSDKRNESKRKRKRKRAKNERMKNDQEFFKGSSSSPQLAFKYIICLPLLIIITALF